MFNAECANRAEQSRAGDRDTAAGNTPALAPAFTDYSHYKHTF